MEDINLQSSGNKRKIHLNFKDSKYATGRRKNLLLEYGLKKDQEKFTLMEKI